MNAVATPLRPGPMERTCLEIARLERAAAFRRERVSRARQRVRESDALLDLVEECRLRDWRLIPSHLWSAVVRAVGSVDPGLRDELGINRDPEHVASVLFAAQELLLERLREHRLPVRAEIIPLFAHVAQEAAG
ncbi:MAG: hypothetical protein JOZ46_09175 [Candidatus Dormibacteraeota bacterium]|nr:hypothetical protein [Candidatus Dormibacteraeota bacterium]MBV9525969.1 hypothetical protein [Candidatus Dormibacteraeota bacterium]